MSLSVPELDDLDFDRLVEEARGLIPRHAPLWTDHNLHDPGITLLELVAWIVDQEIHQVGFVSDRHFQAFSALLGVRPQSAKAAEGLVWPEDGAIDDSPASTGADLERGAPVLCVEQPELAFELTANVHVSLARLLNVVRRARGNVRNCGHYPASRCEVGVELSFDRPLVERVPSRSQGPLCSSSSAPKEVFPVAIGVELDTKEQAMPVPAGLHGELVVDYKVEARPRATEGSAAGTDTPRKIDPPWRRVSLVEDQTEGLSRSGIVLVEIPPEEPDATEPNSPMRPSWLRIRTGRLVNPVPPRIAHVALNVLPIAQIETRQSAAFPRASNGQPDQSFEIDLDGLTGYAVRIEVGHDETFQEWEATGDLSKEGRERKFRVGTDGKVVFGNGVNGEIPPRGAQIRHLPYQLTRGASGNLAAGLNWNVPGVPMRRNGTAFGTNRAPLVGGENAWDTKRLRAETRKQALERRALLTNADLEQATRALEGLAVARAEVRVGLHPSRPGREAPGARTVFVTPARAAESDPLAPVPRRYVEAVAKALSPRRVLGERLSVLAAERVRVRVTASLLIEDGADTTTLIEAATTRLNARLSDIRVQPEIEPWPVGRAVTREEMRTLIAQVPGVVAVPRLLLAKGDEKPDDEDIRLAPDETAIGGEHDISLDTSRSEGVDTCT